MSIKVAAQSLFDELTDNEDDDDEPKMPMISMQKQNSLRGNQAISPMYFLMPKETAQAGTLGQSLGQ